MKKVKLNLVGLNGNAFFFFFFFLMSAFKKAARQQGWSLDEIGRVLEECTQSDYDHLLQTLIANTESEN